MLPKTPGKKTQKEKFAGAKYEVGGSGIFRESERMEAAADNMSTANM